MKNISLIRERSNMPSMFISSSEQPEVKTAFQPVQTNQGQVKTSQISGLICCNSDLANSFQVLKDRTSDMGHPGHYFHKALNNVTQNSRSQSLPSCLDNKKQSLITDDSKGKEEMSLPYHPPDNNQQNNIEIRPTSKEDGVISNESWFKTWPERGIDKLTSHSSSDDNEQPLKHGKQKSGHMSPDESECAHNCLQNSGSVHRSSSVNSILSNKESDLCPLQCSSVSNCCSEKCATKENKMSSSFTPSLNNKPSIDCDNDKQSVCKLKEFGQTQPTKTSIPLTELLQNFPLAYSPITRQLHIISKDNLQQSPLINRNYVDGTERKLDVNARLPGKDINIVKNGLALECIEEEKTERLNMSQKSESDHVLLNGCDDTVSYESPRSTLLRIGTYDTSLSRTDASSFSSIVSSLSDTSPSTNEDTVLGNLLDPDESSASHGGHESLSSGESNCFFEDTGAKPKRRGITGFFSRNVFVWKLSRDATSNSTATATRCSGAPGWKLFGKTPAKPQQLDTKEDPEEECPAGSKQYEDVVASSSALILHQRPSHLPAKSQDEELKHRHEYQRMVDAARKKELKEAKLRKKQLQQQLKVEEQLANAARVWNNEILPKWETMKSSRKAQELWWQGIPPSVRGKVWQLAIGNDLNVTHQLYDICVARAQERLKAATIGSCEVRPTPNAAEGVGMDNPDKEASVELIQLDIARTFPNLCIFQQGGPYYDILHCLLGAYVCYRPDVGYVQGMSFIAAVLILNLEAADAFICFANLLNQPCHMAFFRLNQALMQAYYATYNEFFRENLPRLFAHFSESSLSADLYLLDWLYTVFAKSMPLDVACRVWDVFLRDGEEFLFKTALGVLHLNQEVLLQLDFLHGAQFLTKLPDDLAADQLFKSIESIRMNVGKLRFSEVLANHIDRCREPS